MVDLPLKVIETRIKKRSESSILNSCVYIIIPHDYANL